MSLKISLKKRVKVYDILQSNILLYFCNFRKTIFAILCMKSISELLFKYYYMFSEIIRISKNFKTL